MKKILCSVFASCCIFNLTAFALIEETYKSSYEIGEGTTYTHVVGSNSSGVQRANIIEYSPNSNVVPVVYYGSKVYGTGRTILSAATYLESLSGQIIGGINGDFYTVATGVTVGLLINNGELLCSESWWQNSIGFYDDGTTIIGKPSIYMRLYNDDNYLVIEELNKLRNNSQVFLLNSNFDSQTRNSSSGTEIILKRLDDNKLTAISELSFEVVNIVKTSSSYPIGQDEFVLSISDQISDRVPDVSIGDVLHLKTSTSNSEWTDVTYALGGERTLVENGVLQTNLGTSTAPRTAIGLKADGTVIMYEVDGRNSSFSNGLSLNALAEEMYNLGCVYAMNLDGGGSSSMLIQTPGSNDANVVNSPSDGYNRASANYIFLRNTTTQTGVLDKLFLYPSNNLMLKNASISVDIEGTDKNFFAVSVDDYKNYKDDTTEVINGKYTATKIGDIEITATYGDVSGSTTVKVLDKVDSISVKNQDTNATVTSLSLSQGEKIDLTASALYKTFSVASADNSFEWSVTGDIGTIDEYGFFTASNTKSTGTINVSYNGSTKTTISVSSGLSSAETVKILADFETNYGFVTENALQSYSDLKVANGKKSAMFEYDFSNKNSASLKTSQNLGDFSVLNFKVLGDGTNTSFYANFSDAKGNEYQTLVENAMKNTSFSSFSVIIPPNATIFTGFSLVSNSSNSGIFYIDHITLSNVSNDNTAPVINISNAPTTGSSATISGTIIDGGTHAVDDITVTLNGENITSYTYSQKDGSINYTTKTLNYGINHLVITATDPFGNISTKSFDILNNTDTYDKKSIFFADISSNWAENYINFASIKDIVAGSVSNNTTYFRPTDNLTRAEFAIIIARYLNLDISSKNSNISYSDANSFASWAENYIFAVSNAGIMTGYSSNDQFIFNPNGNITRQEVIAVLGRTIDKGFDVKTLNFSDNSSIANWSYEHFQSLISLGVVSGFTDNTIKPSNNITRAEVCKLIYELS